MSGTTCHITDRGRIQGKTDGKDNGTGYDIREQLTNLLYENRKYNSYDTADDLCAHDGTDTEFTADRSQGRYICEAGTHDNRECCANLVEQRKQL